MSVGRFRVLLGLLFAVLASASFLVVTLVIEAGDDEPSAPTTTSSTAPLLTTTTAPGLSTPTFVAVVVSEADEATARSIGDQLTEGGYDSGVLHSDDYGSLEPGFWVAYVGPFPDVAAAEAAVGELQADGFTAAYPRCVGTDDECS